MTPVRSNVTVADVPSAETVTFVPATGGVDSSVTVIPVRNAGPLSVTVTVAPTLPNVGLIETRSGGGSIVNAPAASEWLPLGFSTATSYVPGGSVPAGSVAYSVSPVESHTPVASHWLTLVASTLPTVMVGIS